MNTTFDSVSVNAKNLIILIVDCNQSNITSKDISLVSFGVEEILNIIQIEQSNEWITTLKWECCYPRMFMIPTCKGRNKGENFLEKRNFQKINAELQTKKRT
ncbi:hypothetical protein GHT06_012778 [Daphnia sinensis]|uniref:Uncharacterized protein n=1 Tax=Daphnia sinensis TaxID=1820382 RepID=A0AAD5KYZ3_9CRUS|nr:hypothetical protein GHT06_012778 [Daphnia sinensis]